MIARKKLSPAVGAPATVDAEESETIDVQVSGLSGGDSLAVSRSINGDTFTTAELYDMEYTTVSTITADGFYSAPGYAHLKFTKTGSASTPTVLVRH